MFCYRMIDFWDDQGLFFRTRSNLLSETGFQYLFVLEKVNSPGAICHLFGLNLFEENIGNFETFDLLDRVYIHLSRLWDDWDGL